MSFDDDIEDEDSDDDIPPSMLNLSAKRRAAAAARNTDDGENPRPPPPSLPVISQLDSDDQKSQKPLLHQKVASPPARNWSAEELEKRDKRHAAVMLQDVISTFGVCRITSLDQVRWHLQPIGKSCTNHKRSGNNKKKKTYNCYPCFCDPQSPLLPYKSGYVIVQYFGSTKYAQNVAHVVPSQLVPFFITTTTAADDEGADKTSSSPFGSVSASFSNAATTFADHVEMYLATLAVQERDKFHPNTTKMTTSFDINGPDHGRVERLFLQGVVDHFIVDHDRPAAAAATAKVGITKRCTDEDYDDDQDDEDQDDEDQDDEDQDDEEEPDDDDDDERRNDQDQKFSAATSSPQKAAAVVAANSSPPRSMQPQRQRQPKHQPPVKVRQVMKLRAGDYIRYCPEYLVASDANMREAIVTEVYPRSNTNKVHDDFAVVLCNGDRLSRDVRIHILRRYLKGSWMDNVGSCFVPLDKCTLDAKLNGTIPVETLADKLHALAQSVRQEVQAMMVDQNQQDNNNNDHHATEYTTTTASVPTDRDDAKMPSTSCTEHKGEKQSPSGKRRRRAPLADSATTVAAATTTSIDSSTSPRRRPRRASSHMTRTFQDRDA